MYDEPINIVDLFRMQAMVHRLACALSNAIPCFHPLDSMKRKEKGVCRAVGDVTSGSHLRGSRPVGCWMMTTKNYDGLKMVPLRQRVERMVIIGPSDN